MRRRSAQPKDEQVTVHDYDVVTQQPVVVAEAISPNEYARLTVIAPVASAYRVVERAATYCASTTGVGDRIVLAVELPGDLATPSAGEVFEWRVVR